MEIPTFDTILELVDSHGEPARCEVEDCEECKQIMFARGFYSGIEGNKKNSGGRSASYIYTAIDENGKEKKLYTRAGMRSHIRCSDKRFNEAINTGISVNGFVIYRDRI